MVEPVQPLNRVPEPKVTGEKHVGPVECEDQEPVRCPGPDAGHLSERGFDLVVGHPSERSVTQAAVDEALGERAKRRALPRREPARPEYLRVRREQFLGRRVGPDR